MGQAHETVGRIIDQPDYSCHLDKSIYRYLSTGCHTALSENKRDVGAADKAAIQLVKVPPYSAAGGSTAMKGNRCQISSSDFKLRCEILLTNLRTILKF